MTRGEAPVLNSSQELPLAWQSHHHSCQGEDLTPSPLYPGTSAAGGLGFSSQVTSKRPCLVGYTRLGFRKWVSKVLEVNEPKRGPPRQHSVLGAFSGG